MARPISATPTLKGEDARRFVAAAQNPQPFTPPKVDNAKLIEQIRQSFKSRGQKHL